MIIFEWQKLMEEKSPSGLLAAFFPLHAPRAKDDLSEPVKQAVESLQIRIFSLESEKIEEVGLRPGNGAILLKGNQIASRFFPRSEAEDMGNWLQNCGAWEQSNQLLMANLECFEFQVPYRRESSDRLSIVFTANVKLDPDHFEKTIAHWLKKKSFLSLEDVRPFFEGCLDASNFSSLVGSCPLPDLLQSRHCQNLVRQQVSKILEPSFIQHGLLLEILEIAWNLEAEGQVSPDILSPQLETITQKIEKRHMRGHLEELRIDAIEPPSVPAADEEVPLPRFESRNGKNADKENDREEQGPKDGAEEGDKKGLPPPRKEMEAPEIHFQKNLKASVKTMVENDPQKSRQKSKGPWEKRFDLPPPF